MIERVDRRGYDHKVYEVAPGKFTAEIQRGVHYFDTDKTFKPCNVNHQTQDFMTGRFSDEVFANQMPFRVSRTDGRLRIYPVWNDYSQWVELIEPTLSALTWTKTANIISATSTKVNPKIISTPEGLTLEFLIKSNKLVGHSFDVAANGITAVKSDLIYLKDKEGTTQAQVQAYGTDSSAEPKSVPVTLALSAGKLNVSYSPTGLVYPVTVGVSLVSWVVDPGTVE